MKLVDVNKSKMDGGSSRRRSSWTKHTSYPTLQNEETIHIPAEISATTRAHIRCAEKRLDASTRRLENIQRKNISQLDSQRRLLEKSMLAYSEKMKVIASSRADELFREIRTANCERDDRIVKSPTASIRSNFSLPARFIAKHHRECRSLKGFHQVSIHSPILERSADCSPVPRSRSAPRRFNHNGQAGHPHDNPLSKQISLKTPNDKKDISSCTVHVDQDFITSEDISKNKVSPRVVTGSIPWLKSDLSDSAYSSASEDIDKDCSDAASDISEKTSRSSDKTSDRTNKNILTVPVVHVRRHCRRNRKKGKSVMNHTHKQTVHT